MAETTTNRETTTPAHTTAETKEGATAMMADTAGLTITETEDQIAKKTVADPAKEKSSALSKDLA